tara:strand:- start:1125 stop:3908 length:2784 start_codon:yes stop_codon:yes gene_type:complete
MTRRVRLPQNVITSLRRGLELYEDGFAGKGLMQSTVDAARRGVKTGHWSEDKIKKASAWFARHEKNKRDRRIGGSASRPTPTYTAWGLWGGFMGGRNFIDREAKRIKENPKSRPAPKSKRIRGSVKNAPGTAAKDGAPIKLSAEITKSLRSKSVSSQIPLPILKKVFRRGAGAYSTSHRPGTTRNQWAQARVNAFIHLVKTGKPKNPNYIADNDLLEGLNKVKRNPAKCPPGCQVKPKPKKPRVKKAPLPKCFGECGRWNSVKDRAEKKIGILYDGPQAVVYTSEGEMLPVRYVMVELDKVIASHNSRGTKSDSYRQELQARQRDSKVSRAQIADLAKDLDPYMLMIPSSGLADGAPVVAMVFTESGKPEIQVVSGNGRIAAIKSKRGKFWTDYDLALVERFQSRPLQSFIKRNKRKAVLVRILDLDDMGTAAELPEAALRAAAGSQTTQSAELSILEAAISEARAAGSNLPTSFGPFNFTDAITGSNVRTFIRRNGEWFKNATARLSSARRASIVGDPDAASDFVNRLLLGSLPPEFTNTQLARRMTKPQFSEALIGSLPALVTIDSLISRGLAAPEWRLSDQLMSAARWVQKAGSKAISAIARDVDIDTRQGDLIPQEDVDAKDTDRLGVAFAVALLRAARRQNPSTAISEYLTAYVNKIPDPNQQGLFGGAPTADPANTLAEIVRFKFVERPTRSNPRKTKRNPSTAEYWEFLGDLESTGSRGLEIWRDGDAELFSEAKGHREARGTRRRAFITKTGKQALSVYRRQLPLFNPAKPRFMMIGDRVDLDVVAVDGKTRTYKMADNVAVATEPEMNSIFFVTIGRETNANPKSAADAWKDWTWGSEVDAVYQASRPTGDQVRDVGEIKRIYYDGRLAEQAEGQSRRVHEFKKPYPRLTVLTDGVTVTRGIGQNASRYKVTERGIIG